jgi:hypothetical protein
VITPFRTEHVAATPRAEDSERLIETLERRNALPKTLAIGSAVRFEIGGRARLVAAAVQETRDARFLEWCARGENILSAPALTYWP